MELKELQNFIYFFTHNKSLNRSQKIRRDKLLARDLESDKSTKLITREKKENDFVPISPLNTALFFSQFNDPLALKYLTHDFDVNDDERPHSMPSLIKQVKEVIDKKEQKMPDSLWALIHGFIFKGKWLDTYENVHTSSFTDKLWMVWSEMNNMHPICNPNFRSEIMAFRSTVRVVPPVLQEIIDKLKAETSLNITTEQLAKADFYTNTYILNKVIKRIFAMMDKRSGSFHDVTVAYTRSQDPEGRMLRNIVITQKGSFASKPLTDVKGRLDRSPEAGDFGAIRSMLNGYCFWSVTSVWEGNPYKWNILKDSDMGEIEPISGDVEGFTHKLTFYIV